MTVLSIGARRRATARLLTALLLFLATALDAAEPASIHGSIKDPQGAVIPDAKVELLRNGRTVETAVTDQFGNYRFAHLAIGDYQVRAAAPGFSAQQSQPVHVGVSDSPEVDLALKVAGVGESIVVSATGTPIPESQVGASITVLTAAEYQNRLDVLEPLQQVPGLQVVQSGERGAATSLFIRGGNSTANKVLMDGVPLNDIGGVVNFGTVATAGVEQVEVLRGPNSVLYGPDAMAGVVSLTTRRGATPVPELSYAFDAGNFSSLHHDVSLGGTFHPLDYLAEFSRTDTGNSLPNSTFHNATYVANVGLKINANTDLRFTGRYTTAALGQPNAILFFGIPDDSFEKDQDAFVSVSFQNQTTQRWHNLLRYGATRLRLQDVNPSPTGIPDGSGNSLGLPVTIKGANGTSVTGQAILDFAGDYPAITSSSTKRDSVYFQSDCSFNAHLTGLVAFRFEQERGFTLAFGTSTPAERGNYSYIAEVHGSVGSRTYATLGGSVEKNPVFGTTALPRVSLAYYLVRPSSNPVLNGTKLKFNYGQGIREPSIFESSFSLFGLLSGSGGAPDLISQFHISPIAAERSRSYDAGLEQYAANGRLKVSSTFFYNQFTNQIEFVPSTALPALGVPDAVVNNAGFGATINSGDVRARGLENEVEASLGHGLSARVTYTWLDEVVQRSFTSDAFFCSPPNPQPFCGNPAFPGVPIGAFAPLVGARPFRRAPHSGSFALNYARKQFTAGITGYLVSRRDDSTFLTDSSFGPSLLLPNHDLAPGFQKLDLTAGYRFNPHLAFYSVVENLLSQHYQPVFGFPAAPLSFRSGLKLTLGGESRNFPW